MKLWAMLCRTSQDRRVIVESSDNTWSTAVGNGKPPQDTHCENPVNSIKRPKDMTPKEESCRSESVQYATRKEWSTTANSSRKNEVAGPNWKWCSVVDISGDESKMWCGKEQYCTGTWDVRSMNQGKLDTVEQEMARVNIDILGISELK